MKKTFILTTFLTIVGLLTSINCLAVNNIPEKVRIGLYYGSNPAPYFKLTSQSGLIVGYNSKNDFAKLFEVSDLNGVSIRRDSYYTLNNGVFTAASQANAQFGPYHAEFSGNFQTIDDAKQKVLSLKNKGIEAYLAFDGNWRVWSGFCIDSHALSEYIENKLEPLSDQEVNAVEFKQDRVVVLSGENTLMVFGGDNIYLSVRPIDCSGTPVLKINDKASYRGEIEVRRYLTSDMTVINILPVEKYLYGVVPREIGASSPAEAIKAQAVAARNYTVKSIGKNAKWGFDMTNTISDQAYGGYDWERETTNKGVDDTADKLLIYQGVPISAYYFSTSGGKTEDVKNVWNTKEDFPYLVSVDDKYEPVDAPKSNWEVTLTSDQIKASLKAQGIDIGDILSVQTLEFTESGRVLKMKIVGTKGEKTAEKGLCRTILGKEVQSQWFRVVNGTDISVKDETGYVSKISTSGLMVLSATGKSVISGGNIYAKGEFENRLYAAGTTGVGFKICGKGAGHGIGMSQVGAIGMAKAGFNYEQILQWYYKGTNVE